MVSDVKHDVIITENESHLVIMTHFESEEVDKLTSSWSDYVMSQQHGVKTD